MSRWEFMRQLESLLSDISPNEREEALQYYNDYFNDAGRENEQEVIKALGSPEQVAKIVKDGLTDNPAMGEFTETGFLNQDTDGQNAIIKRPRQSEGTNAESIGNASAADRNTAAGNAGAAFYANGNGNSGSEQAAGAGQNTGGGQTKAPKDEFPVWAIVLIVIGCIICSPVILGVAGTLLGVIVSIFATLLALILGFGLAAIILLIVAVSLIAGGFGSVFSSPVAAVGLLGGGLICLSLGILFMLLAVFLVGKLIPAICQGIAYIFKKIFGKKEAAV